MKSRFYFAAQETRTDGGDTQKQISQVHKKVFLFGLSEDTLNNREGNITILGNVMLKFIKYTNRMLYVVTVICLQTTNSFLI